MLAEILEIEQRNTPTGIVEHHRRLGLAPSNQQMGLKGAHQHFNQFQQKCKWPPNGYQKPRHDTAPPHLSAPPPHSIGILPPLKTHEHVPMTPLQLLPLGLALVSLFAPVSQEPGATDQSEAQTLFLANCASCHGELGDGDGTTQLDRPARSFKDGGFSFGNTPGALFRTLTTGIPGTPMPGFESALSVEQRKLLADYVVTLGPPSTDVDQAQTEVAVLDRPVFVRGLLPPLTDSALPVPRGLVLGLPSGQSFEYRTDDVRLLGVRYGAFVRRADWTGRGGSGLEPLGRVAATIERGAPDATFLTAEGAPLLARFRGSWIEGGSAGITYDLVRADGAIVAHVKEAVRSRNTFAGLGYTRTLELRGTGVETSVALRRPRLTKDSASEAVGVIRFEESGAKDRSRTWSALQHSKNLFDCHIGPWCDAMAAQAAVASVPLKTNAAVVIETTHLTLNQFTSQTLGRLKKDLAR